MQLTLLESTTVANPFAKTPKETKPMPTLTFIDSKKEFKSELGSKAPRSLSELEKLTLSVGCGRRIFVYHESGHVHLIRCPYGQNSWDAIEQWRQEDGTFSPNYRGPERARAACKALAERITKEGLAGALKAYTEMGICCSCGADLTDPVSKLRGIGPECIKKIEAQRIMRLIFGG